MVEETKAMKIEEYNLMNDARDYYKIVELDKIFQVEGEAPRNEELLHYLSSSENIESSKVIRDLSVTIAHFIFRNGPVERIHNGRNLHFIENLMEIPPDTPLKDIGQLTQKDMEILNKFMVDRIGYLLTLYQQADYTKLKDILKPLTPYGAHWDSPNIEKVEDECFNSRWKS